MTGPVIVRPSRDSNDARPGRHSHNVRRRADAEQPPEPRRWLKHLRTVLFLVGICAIGYYGYTLADEHVYQAYENWAFDQQIAGNTSVTFTDYVRDATPFGFLVGGRSAAPVKEAATQTPIPAPAAPRPVYGSVLGRVEIPRLHLSAIVREGVDAKMLSLAVGHVPSTALPGQPGNFAIAAHRDTLFRALKDIRKGDLVTIQSTAGTYTYQVAGTKIVKPSDVSVLRADGGGVIPQLASDTGQGAEPKILTMITCYPFYYVGSAPKRFIVEAKLISNDPASTVAVQAPAASPPQSDVAHVARKRHEGLRAKRSPSRVRETKKASYSGHKKRGFWHRVFHIS